MAKIKKILSGLIFMAIVALALLGVSSAHAINFTYQPMEKIPGFEDVNISDFPTLIQTIYKFALWVAGICALFMISVGGYSYMTSAGNTSKAGVGKQIITDALIGLVLVLIAVLIFSVINPSLTTINLQISPTAGPAPTAPAVCNGSCRSEACSSLAGATNGVGTCSDSSRPNCCVFFTDRSSCPGGDCSLSACTTERPAISGGNCGDRSKACCRLDPTGGRNTCSLYPHSDSNVINFSTSETLSLPTACSSFQSGFQSAASSEGIDIKILKAIAATESTCRADAGSDSSCGLMQLRPSTAGQSCQWLKDHPAESILIAARYIKANQGTHSGSIEKIAAGYNAGYGTAANPDGTKPAFAPSSDCPGALAYQCCINPGGLDETQDYVFKVEKYYNGQ